MYHRKPDDLHNQHFPLPPAHFFSHFSFCHVDACKYFKTYRSPGMEKSIHWATVQRREFLKQTSYIRSTLFRAGINNVSWSRVGIIRLVNLLRVSDL